MISGRCGIATLLATLLMYLRDLLPASDAIARVDELVSNDELVGLPDGCSTDFENLHRKFALCVWDDETHRAAPSAYIREPEMRKLTEAFIDKWGRALSREI